MQEFRLAELVAGLSVASDLGKGLTDGQGMRACTLAAALAERLDLPLADREAVYWVGLLRFVGCTATASEMAASLGDELAVSAAFAEADVRDLRDLLGSTVAAVGPRPDRVVSFLISAPRVVREHEVASCEVAQSVATQLRLPAAVTEALGQVFERWDGHGHPGVRHGADLHPAARVWQVAHLAELLSQHGQPAEVARLLRRRAGRALDPDMARAAADAADDLLASRAADIEAVLAAEPLPHRLVAAEQAEGVLSVFGLLADLKSPAFLGHSRRVAELAAASGRACGRPAEDVGRLRMAGHLHDVGRVAVSARIWDKAGPLSDAEREQVRLHPYFTARVLTRVPVLRGLADLACAHHERCDGSGYHRGLAGPALSPLAALLSAADAYVTAGEPRPYRAPRTDPERVALLREQADAGRLPPTAVDAVLTAAGQLPPRTSPTDGALTVREREVLALVAAGLTNVAAGRRLGISAKTVNAHLEHVYAKLGVSTRASAVVHALHRGELVP